MLFGRGRIDDVAHLRDAVGRKAGVLRMLPDQLGIGRAVDAVDLVIGDVAMDPLDVGSHILEHAAGLLRRALQLPARERAGTGHFTFDHELGHGETPHATRRKCAPLALASR